MGSRAVSPGGALLRTSRMFSLPKPLPEANAVEHGLSANRSDTMTTHRPQYQAIMSPLSSREKGDFGIKRPFPVRAAMGTSNPILSIKHVDAVENVTDLQFASGHSLTLEKFQEMQIAMVTPASDRRAAPASRSELASKSVFEEEMDVTDNNNPTKNNRRWKFEGPWLARMTEGEFLEYIRKVVRPKRAQFREMLRQKFADDKTTAQNNRALEAGSTAPPPVKPEDISMEEFGNYLRALRNDRVTLYALVSRFLDLAPLGQPVGIVQSIWPGRENASNDSPWAKTGPPPSHPSAGISYLRTNSVMDNHPVYGPQARRTPVLARVLYPRVTANPAKLGVGGFVADAPYGDNEFNVRHGRFQSHNQEMLKGITHLDTTTLGGAKAFVEPRSATVESSGRIVVTLSETRKEAQLLAKEKAGQAVIYESKPKEKPPMVSKGGASGSVVDEQRMGRVSDEIVSDDLLAPKGNAGGRRQRPNEA